MYKLLVIAIFIAALSQPVGAFALTRTGARDNDVPVLFDAGVLRPLGFLLTVSGFTVWTVTAPIQAITRPTDMHKTFKSWVINPARYTWVDPLGYHPDRYAAELAGEIE